MTRPNPRRGPFDAWPNYDSTELLLMVKTIPGFWRHLERDPSASWIRQQLASRVLARPELIEALPLDAHDVVPCHASG
jgi:hypothetical protein